MPKGIKYGKWEEENMERALAALRNGDLGLNAAAKQYSVPKATLKRHLDGKNCFAVEGTKVVGSVSDLPPAVEEEICQHVLRLEECMFGMTPTDLRKLAFSVAEKNNIPHRFNREKKIAGKKWYYNFMRRHKDLSLRQPEATSIARATGFNRERVGEFFDILTKIVDDNKLNATRIFNADETGLSTVQKKTRRIIAKRGKQQVGSITSGERGVTTTAVCCASAAGQYIPPMLIFKRARSKDELMDGAPPGTVFAFNPDSGYINKELFVQYLQHFINTVKPSNDHKVLLLLDGHTTHTRNPEALDLARDCGVILLSLPGHTTHRLQPLDVSFFKPLNTYYIDEMEKWLRVHPGRVVTQFQVAELFGRAYGRAATVGTAINGFAHAGVWPVNRDVFKDHHFSTSTVLQSGTNSDVTSSITTAIREEEPTVEASTSTAGVETSATTAATNPISEEVQAAEATTPAGRKSAGGATTPTESRASLEKKGNSTDSSKPTTSRSNYNLVVPLTELSPLPKAATTVASTRSKKGTQKALVLTSSPYKQQLSQSTAGLKRKKLTYSLSESKKTDRGTNGDWYCEMCQTRSVEDMIQCMSCRQWVHENCAGVKKNVKKYFCSNCM